VKIVRHSVRLALGVVIGTCLYSPPEIRPVFPIRKPNDQVQVKASAPRRPLPAPLIPWPWPAPAASPVRARPEKPFQAATREDAEVWLRLEPSPDAAKIAGPVVPRAGLTVANRAFAPPAAKGKFLALSVASGLSLSTPKVRIMNAAPDPSVTATFKPLGYVEKAGGELEAIILQENEVQVVHIGDLISGRYRVTKIAPDSVVADDDTLMKLPMIKPGGAESLGYVEEANGRVEAVVADGDTVRLVPKTPAATMAQISPWQALEGALPAQSTASLAAAVSATMRAMADRAVSPEGSSVLSPHGAVGHVPEEFSMLTSGVAEWPSSERSRGRSTSEEDGRVRAGRRTAPLSNPARLSALADLAAKLPVIIKPLGFVVKGDGEFDAILADDHDVYIVRQGDRFAGRYRALSVSADAVEAVEDPPAHAPIPPFTVPPTFTHLFSAPTPSRRLSFWGGDFLGCEPHQSREVAESVLADRGAEVGLSTRWKPKDEQHPSAKGLKPGSTPPLRDPVALPNPGTFIFQTLGYVETASGEMRAIVADESQVYLVKQGEVFADQYRATSVDPTVVLAVRVFPGRDAGNFRSGEAERIIQPASNKLDGHWRVTVSGLASVQGLNPWRTSGGPALMYFGVNLPNWPLAGVGVREYFIKDENLNIFF